MDISARNLCSSILISFVFFALLACVLIIQASQLVRSESQRNAEKLLDFTESMLSEADMAYKEVSTKTGMPCTEMLRDYIDNIVVSYPHLHSVSITTPQGKTCSSLAGIFSSDIFRNESLTRDISLKIYHDQIKKHIQLLLIKTFHHSDGTRIDVAISGVFLQKALAVSSVNNPLYFRIGPMKLDPSGYISTFPPTSDTTHYLSLPGHSFSILYAPVLRLSLLTTFSMLPYMLLIYLLISLFIGVGYHFLLKQKKSLRHNLSKAIKNDELKTVYQPVVNAVSGEIIGFEALCRWHHTTEGIIPPDVFIPLAEKNGLIISLTQHQLTRITCDLKYLVTEIKKPIYISVNFSQQHCASEAFIHDCSNFMKIASPLNVKLVVEITEREPVSLTSEQRRNFSWLKESGIGLALDDFGTGYSNLSFISELIPDYIKLDKMFVSEIGSDNTILLDCITELATELGISVIAEGIEDISQVHYLLEQDVTYQQGYYWYRPMDLSSLLRRLLTLPQ